MRFNRFVAFATALLSLACLAPGANAAVRTWDGSASGHWTNAANWTTSVAPTNGDGLVFPANAARLIMTNTANAPTNFTFIHFIGSNYFLYSGGLSLTNGLTNAPGISQSNVIRAAITTRGNQTWSVAASTALSLQSNLSLSTFDLTLADAGAMEVRGNLTGSAGSSLVKLGAGILTLSGSANSLPELRVTNGQLAVNGILTATTFAISNTATLSGIGTVSPFVCAGTVRPGGINVGVLTVSAGVATFNSGSTLQINIQGATPGSGYDQLRVSSPPNLSRASLSVLLSSYIPAPGDTFVIITNTGGAAFSTTFAGLSEGSALVIGGTRFAISYVGGNGNDVTLRVVPFPSLFNANLDLCHAVEIVPGFFLPKPLGWANVGARNISGPYENEMSSEPWAGPAPTPVTTDGSANPPHPEGCSGTDCGVFFLPFSGNATDGSATGHLYQDIAATPGTTYAFSGWAGAEANALMTRAEFALDFFNAANVLVGSATNNLIASGLFTDNGQAFDYKLFRVAALAPPNTTIVRVRASMVGGMGNPAGGGQAYVVDDFTLSVLTNPTINTQPQSRTNILGTTATFTVGAMGHLPLSYRWRRGNTVLSDGAHISGATTTTLTLSSVLFPDATNYSVIVSNSFGSITSTLATLTVVASSTNNLLFNPHLDFCQAVEIVPGFFLPKPAGWANVGSRTIAGPYEDEMSSEPWAGPAPTPVTTNGNANPPHPQGCGGPDCAVFFKAFSGSAANGAANGHLYQDNPAIPGFIYTLSGWAGAEPNLLVTRAEFAIEFFDGANAIIGGSTNNLSTNGLFIDNGQAFDYKQYIITATAPPNAVTDRCRASMIGGMSNPMGGGQAFVIDDFSLTAQPVARPRITAIRILLPSGARRITCLGETNRNYTLQAVANLTTPIGWANLMSTNSGSIGVFEFTDSAPLSARRFYRLQ